jgi:hypothetical protein
MRSVVSRCSLDVVWRWDQNTGRRPWASLWNPQGRMVGSETRQWCGGSAQGLGWRDSSNVALVNPNTRGLCIKCVEQEDTQIARQGWVQIRARLWVRWHSLKVNIQKDSSIPWRRKSGLERVKTRSGHGFGACRSNGFKLLVWKDWKNTE